LPIRLSKYGNQSHCIHDRDLQNYCYCKWKYSFIKFFDSIKLFIKNWRI
jgi:hypothetical protein